MLLTILLGQGSSGLQNYELIADAGSFTLSGQAAELDRALLLNAAAGGLAITGQPATLTRQSVVVASAGALTFTGQSATLLLGRSLNAVAGSLAVTGQAASTTAARSLTASAGNLSVTGQAASFFRGYTQSADSGSLTITGQNAELIKTTANRELIADAGSFAVTGQAATLARSRTMSADAGSLNITGQSASLLVSRSLNAGVGGFDILGQTASLLTARRLNAQASGSTDNYTDAEYVDTGYDANPGYSLDAQYIDEGYTEPAYFGSTDARLLVGRTLAANSSSIVITGFPATLEINRFYQITELSMQRLIEVWRRLELDPANPVTITATSLTTGSISQTISASGASRTGALATVGAQDQNTLIEEVWQRLGLDSSVPMTQTESTIVIGAINIGLTGTTTVVAQRA